MERPSIHLCDRLDHQQLADICTGTADLILALSDDGRIEDASSTLILPRSTVAGWIGRRLIDIASPESVEKLQHCPSREADKGAPVWRHVNLVASDGSMVPLLARFVGAGGRLLLARDLKPLQEAVARFQHEQMELVRRYEDRIDALEAACRTLRDALAEKHGAAAGTVTRPLTWQTAKAAQRRSRQDADRAAPAVGLSTVGIDRILPDDPGGT